MRILVVTHTTPNTPTKDGMTLILYYLLQQLQTKHTITTYALDQYNSSAELVAAMQPKIDSADVIYLHGPQAVQLITEFNHDHNIVAGMIDAQSYKYQQLADRETSRLAKHKWQKQAAQWLEFEQTQLSHAKHIIVATQADYQALTKLVGGKSFITVIPNGVDHDYFQPNPDIAQENAIIFSGILNQPSHVQSLLYFYKHIWPNIKTGHPDATNDKTQHKPYLYIVGKDPDKKIQKLEKLDKAHITVTGFVPEVKEFLLRCKLFISPIHLRSGMRNTVLEAMSCGLPVVAFGDACQGLEASPIRKVSTDADFANTVNALLEDDALRANVGVAARSYIVKHHDWPAQSKRYEYVFEQTSHA